jgi:hypothetical protein
MFSGRKSTYNSEKSVFSIIMEAGVCPGNGSARHISDEIAPHPKRIQY